MFSVFGTSSTHNKPVVISISGSVSPTYVIFTTPDSFDFALILKKDQSL
jgi:hypothetical protein